MNFCFSRAFFFESLTRPDVRVGLLILPRMNGIAPRAHEELFSTVVIADNDARDADTARLQQQQPPPQQQQWVASTADNVILLPHAAGCRPAVS